MKGLERAVRGLLFLTIPGLISCSKTDSIHVVPVEPKVPGGVKVNFFHFVNGSVLLPDSLAYQTSAGYRYKVIDLQYFISDVRLHLAGSKWIRIKTDRGIHYTDIHLSSTTAWKLDEDLPEGVYDSLAFTFGFSPEENLSGRFPDPPERDMFWPAILGGGYHYMKLNLKYEKANVPGLMPFMFHLGIGQMYLGTTHSADSIIGYIHNHFTIQLPLVLKVYPGGAQEFAIGMNLEKWFDAESAFDFSAYPAGIMQDQEGLYKACRNGRHAFMTVSSAGEMFQ